jgi:hypothetical protein
MFSVDISWITGCMLGIEFLSKEDADGAATVVLDLFICRICIFHEDDNFSF